MMRIVIEIDGDNVQVQTDRQSPEKDNANVVDAGSAPIDLLRQHGEGEGLADESHARPEQQRTIKPIKPSKDTPLNPLRAGQAAARQLVQRRADEDAESREAIDAGQAPTVPRSSGKEKTRKPRGDKK